MAEQYTLMHYAAAIFQNDEKITLYREGEYIYFECNHDRLYVEDNGVIYDHFFDRFVKAMTHIDEETKNIYISQFYDVFIKMVDKTLAWIG